MKSKKFKFLKEDKPISPLRRIIYFIIGMLIASAIIVYGISWTQPPFELTFAGIVINQWVAAAMIVLAGLFAGSLIKSAILGKTKLD